MTPYVCTRTLYLLLRDEKWIRGKRSMVYVQCLLFSFFLHANSHKHTHTHARNLSAPSCRPPQSATTPFFRFPHTLIYIPLLHILQLLILTERLSFFKKRRKNPRTIHSRIRSMSLFLHSTLDSSHSESNSKNRTTAPLLYRKLS